MYGVGEGGWGMVVEDKFAAVLIGLDCKSGEAGPSTFLTITHHPSP